MSTNVVLRLPTGSSAPSASAGTQDEQTFTPPTHEWLSGTWFVVQSTLPMWKTSRNVRIEYSRHQTDSSEVQLNDTVHYQSLSCDANRTVAGIDRESVEGDTGAWNWRGKGLLKIASSHWEVLGWGSLSEGSVSEDDACGWAVTYFSKTLFTPAGLDIYFRRKEGPGPAMIDSIKRGLKALGDPGTSKLADELFEVRQE